MQHVHSYDTNPSESHYKLWDSDLPVGPEAALGWLAEDNQKQAKAEGPPNGPVRFCWDVERFVLVSAWTSGRQWFWVLTIFSPVKLTEDEFESLLAKYLPEAAEEDEEDEYED